MNSLEDLARGLAGQTVVLTGAGGFIGRRLLTVLEGSGARVTVLLRSRHGAAALTARGIRVVPCDLAAGSIPTDALPAADVLFHFAYDLRASGAENLTGTRALLAAAAAAGVGRIVHASSVVVYDDWPEGALAETSPRTAHGASGYRQSKIAMEQLLEDAPLPSVILQPTIVYGPGSALWTEAPLAALRQGGVVLPDPPGMCPAVHVDDVVQAALRAALLPDPGIAERFLISGPDALTWAAFYQGYADLLGGGTVQLAAMDRPQIGPQVARGPSAAARISALARRLIGRARFENLVRKVKELRPASGPARPDPAMLLLYMARPIIDLGHAVRRLGYRPQVGFAAGLDTIRAQLHR